MKKNKLAKLNYKCSVHTLATKSEGAVANEVAQDVMKSNTIHHKDGSVTTKSIINPNKLNGDLFDFVSTMDAIDRVMCESGLDQYRITRLDLRYDSYNPHDFDRFQKMHKYLIAALGVTYKVRNCYETKDLFSDKKLNAAIKNDYFEAENYDRAAKSRNTENHVEPATNRLEFRTVAKEWNRLNAADRSEGIIDKDWNANLIQKEFTENWLIRLDNALEHLPDVWDRYNTELEKIYKRDKDVFPKKFLNVNQFVMQHQNDIFHHKQLVDLLARLGEENPESKARNYKKNHGIEYFTPKDMRTVVAKIKAATLKYFEV